MGTGYSQLKFPIHILYSDFNGLPNDTHAPSPRSKRVCLVHHPSEIFPHPLETPLDLPSHQPVILSALRSDEKALLTTSQENPAFVASLQVDMGLGEDQCVMGGVSRRLVAIRCNEVDKI